MAVQHLLFVLNTQHQRNMKYAIQLITLVTILIFLNLISIFHYRNKLDQVNNEIKQLSQEYADLSSNSDLTQFAWATSSCGNQDTRIKQFLPETLPDGAIAVRISDLQCSSCIDYVLFQLKKLLSDMHSEPLFVLYSAKNEKHIKHPFRIRLLSEAIFIRIPEDVEITPLDRINIPYLMTLGIDGNVQSTFLPYNASEENIEAYLNHISNNQITSK